MAKCSNCGSSNVSFRRENVGEVRGRGAKQVVHRTVGYCKDCGNTWVSSSDDISVPRKRKTWLWVLGWLFIFPLPLTILLLRNQNMNKIVKYAIIVIAWLAYLGMAKAGISTTETTSSSPTSNIQETAPQQAEDKSIDVSVAVEPVVNSDNGKVLFKITTNLPEDTELLVTVKNDSGYTGQDKAVVLANGVANTAEFSNAGGGTDGDAGEGLKGSYTVDVTMGIASTQKENVRAIIGEKGENLKGQYVEPSSISESNVVRASFNFEF